MRRVASIAFLMTLFITGGFITSGNSNFTLLANRSQRVKVTKPVPTHPGGLLADPEPQYGYSFVSTAISHARKRVWLVMYELSDQSVIASLEAAHRRGVDVRILLDSAYSGKSYNTEAFKELRAAHVAVRWTPASTIVHQKTLLVDNHAWIMTGNLTPQYYSSSVDFVVSDTQAQDVREIAAAFIEDWNGDLKNTPYSTPIEGLHGDLIFSPESESTLVDLINQARPGTTLLTENEEMNSYTIQDALEAAAHRGVDVKVVMTDSYYWSQAFNQLVANGVHVSTYSYYAPVYIHAKAIVINNSEVYVGSINYSTASMIYNRELGIITNNPAVVKVVENTLNTDFSNAKPWK